MKMDLKFNKLNCKICFKQFNEGSRCPRTLQCGHSYCYSCLSNLMKQSLLCPICKVSIKYPTAEAIPVNYCIKQFVSDLEASSEDKGSEFKRKQMLETQQHRRRTREMSKKFRSEGFCEEHEHDNELNCMDCRVWVCGVCATLQHKEHRVLIVEEALNEMKAVSSKRVAKGLQNCELQTNSLNIDLKDLRENRDRLRLELSEYEKKIETLMQEKSKAGKSGRTLKSLASAVAASNNHTELSLALKKIETCLGEIEAASPRLGHLSFTVEDLKLWCRSKAVYVVRNEAETRLHGRVGVQNEEVRICSFRTETPDELSRIIPIEDLLRNLSADLQPPHTTRGFLMLCDTEDGSTFELGLRIKDTGPRGRNFLLLCAGVKGPSYKGLQVNNCSWGFCLSAAPPPVVGDGDWVSSMASMKKGVTWGMNEWDSRFGISMSDNPSWILPDPFGQVETGLSHLEKRLTKGRLLQIVDGGFIFE